MKLFVPLLEMPPHGVQLVVDKSVFCCKLQPVKGFSQYGQDTFRLLPERVMVNFGIGVARNPWALPLVS
jgi:hypothetical protein